MSHPYRDLPDRHFWSRSVAAPGAHEIDPVAATGFALAPDDKVGTLGSCFAQHLSRFIRRSGLTYFVAETGTAATEEDAARGFGVFSARYGNVYTVAQAVQLFDRAFGAWTPTEQPWRLGESWVDPFRPQVEPSGFESIDALEADRAAHLAAVRRVFTESDVLVFTLGLTETWRVREDGAVLPVVPGASGGEFDPDRYEFVNFGLSEVRDGLLSFIDRVRSVNPGVRFLLTVSPVPLIATYSEQHVLTATTYSKAVLRVAAAEAQAARDGVDYFPSYEIITGPATAGRYFESDLRSVTDAGVSHVMRVFSRHYFADVPAAPDADRRGAAALLEEFARTSSVVCDEEVLDRR